MFVAADLFWYAVEGNPKRFEAMLELPDLRREAEKKADQAVRRAKKETSRANKEASRADTAEARRSSSRPALRSWKPC